MKQKLKFYTWETIFLDTCISYATNFFDLHAASQQVNNVFLLQSH